MWVPADCQSGRGCQLWNTSALSPCLIPECWFLEAGTSWESFQCQWERLSFPLTLGLIWALEKHCIRVMCKAWNGIAGMAEQRMLRNFICIQLLLSRSTLHIIYQQQHNYCRVSKWPLGRPVSTNVMYFAWLVCCLVGVWERRIFFKLKVYFVGEMECFSGISVRSEKSFSAHIRNKMQFENLNGSLYFWSCFIR